METKMPPMRITKLRLSGESYTDESLSKQEAETFIKTMMDAAKNEGKEVSDSICTALKTLPGKFSMQIYYVYRNISLTSVVASFLAGNERDNERDVAKNERLKDIMIFFTRTTFKEPDRCYFFPELFALTSGYAHRILKENQCDEEFPIQCARRVLEFNVNTLASKHLTGPHSSSAVTYRRDEGRAISFLDVLGQITNYYKAPLREHASLYTLKSLQTEQGEPLKVSMTVGYTYIKLSHQINLKDTAHMLDLLSNIARGEQSFSCKNRQIEETDDDKFDVFSQLHVERKPSIVQNMNAELRNRLTSHLKDGKIKLDLFLTPNEEDAWLKTNTFALEKNLEGMETWTGDPPVLEELMEVVRKRIPKEEYDEVIDKLYFTFDSSDTTMVKQPLLELIEGHFMTKGISMFYHCGKWLRFQNEYLVQLENLFAQVRKDISLEDNVLVLKWLVSGADKTQKKKGKDKAEAISQTMKRFQMWVQQTFGEKLQLKEYNLEMKDNPHPAVQFDMYPKSDDKKSKVAKQLILRMFCKQDEAKYNEGYILYDHLLTGSTSGYLLGDRIVVKNVELYDILYYTPDKTYLIHVKEGFRNTIRDVCSQIRNSAKLVFQHFICNNNFGILKMYWSSVTNYKGDKKYRQAVKDRYRLMKLEEFERLFSRKEIVFVLAYRDIVGRPETFVPLLYPKERLKNVFAKEYPAVEKALLDSGYVIKHTGSKLYLTDKVFLTKIQARNDIKLPSKEYAERAFDVLKETYSNSSTIAKMEVVQLYRDFREFVASDKRLSLKICCINPSKTEIVDTEPKEETETEDTEPEEETEIVDTEPEEETEIVVTGPEIETEIVETEPKEETAIVDTEPEEETEIVDTEPQRETEIVDTEPGEESDSEKETEPE